MSQPQLQLQPLPPDVVGEPAPPPPPVDPVTALVDKLLDADFDAAKMTKVYLAIRDKKKDLEAAAKLKIAPLTEALARIEGAFLAKMLEQNTENLKNAEGTPYITMRTSVTMADSQVYWKWVLQQALAPLPLKPEQVDGIVKVMMESGALAYIEDRPAKAPVEAFKETNQALPPGINYSATQAVNVKK